MKYINNLKRISLITLCMLSISMATAVYAQDSAQTQENTTSVSPRAESTGYKYMTVNGVKYKRLWSYTRGCWVDPVWTPCD